MSRQATPADSDGETAARATTMLLPCVRDIANPETASRLQMVREFGASLSGFNHPLYPDGDLRANLILEKVSALRRATPNTTPTLDFLALAKQRLSMHPGVAIALVVLARALGLPDGTATALWIISRTAGWVSHVLEQRA